MVPQRIQNPSEADIRSTRALLESGSSVTIQFNEPVYTDDSLHAINQLCRAFNDKLEVRFYGFYRNGFDASCLLRLPEVRWLSVDCLQRIDHFECVSNLEKVEKLAVGVFELDAPDLLTRLPLENLKSLRLSETRRNKVDLSYIKSAKRIERLSISNHSTNLEVIGEMHGLKYLSLRSIPKKHSLAFIGKLQALQALCLILGGRESIEEISCPSLQELEINQVLGLKELGSLGRFTSLETFLLFDQARLGELDLDELSPALRVLRISNCRKLKIKGDLRQLSRLADLGLGRIGNDFDWFTSLKHPRSLKSVRFWTPSTRKNKEIRTHLNELGYAEFHKLERL